MLPPTGPGRSWGVPSPDVLDLVRAYLHDVARHTHARLGDVAGVAVTSAVSGGRPVTAGASTALAEQVDAVQYALGHGPCLHALNGGGESYVRDLARDPTWGRYGPEAAALGARSCLSVPVEGRGPDVLGVVKVYSGRVDGLDEEQRRIARALALEVAGGLGLGSTLVETSLELRDRTDAMDTRRTIDLATGLLMGRLGCSAEEAFDLLRRESQHHNTKVHDVAADLLARPAVPVDGLPPTAGGEVHAHGGGRAPFRRRGEAPAQGR